MHEPENKYCPETTMWGNKKVLKPVYLLDESKAIIINKNNSENN